MILLLLILAAICGVLLGVGIAGDAYDARERRDARKRSKEPPRWR